MQKHWYKLSFLLLMTIALLGAIPKTAGATQTATAVYKSLEGIEVISYSQAWDTTKKLEAVYQELLLNTHGEELKLLNKIILYPEIDQDSPDVNGRWFGDWNSVNGKITMKPNRYIELYNCNWFDSIEKISKTLSHEYGHHFTFYYYFKQEKKEWDTWRNTGLAKARGLQKHPKVNADGDSHMWLIQEIAAEDYVQLFGSPTAKKSVDFHDIAEQLRYNDPPLLITGDIYNFSPQENYELPLAANIKGLREYWVKAANLPTPTNMPPTQINLQLKEVVKLPDWETRQYVFSWDKSQDENIDNLDYTLINFGKMWNNELIHLPVKTVDGTNNLISTYGAAKNEDYLLYESLQKWAYFVVYVKDETGLITSSRLLAVDFDNPNAPESVLIDDKDLLTNNWFYPRVKINGNQLTMDVAPVLKNGRTLIPLRTIFENLGASVEWEASTQTIRAKKGATELTLQIGKYQAIVNGQEVTLEVPPQIKDGRTLVPLRFVSEALGADVKWSQKLQLIYINSTADAQEQPKS